jgi:two-component system response regulator YesN
MYSILLVDDETMVRKVIKAKIPWEEYGFVISGEAENGLEALEIIQDQNPDVIITDIKMPYMDGLTLVNEMRKLYPEKLVIILSGYDEFTYAQKAIQLGVSYYILKPINKDNIIELLQKIKINLDKKIQDATDRQKLKDLYNNMIPDMQEQLINEIYEGKYKENISKAVDYKLPIDKDFYITAIIEIENQIESLETLAIRNIVDKYFKQDETAITSTYKNQSTITFFYKIKIDKEQEEKIFIKYTLKKIEDLFHSISFYTKINCNIGVSKPVYTFSNLHVAWLQAINALNYKTYYPEQNILYIGDHENEKFIELTTSYADDALQNLINIITTGNTSTIDSAVDSLFAKETRLHPLELKSYFYKILTTIISLASELEITNNKNNVLESLSSASEANTIQEIRVYLKDILKHINIELQHKRKQSGILFINQAKHLIEVNYKVSDFGLDTICDKLNVSNTYFSSTFKKETGTAFVKALNKTRIEHSKTLLNNPDLKTYEIAEMVGFTDPNYFSFCFKKLTGISPKMYRKSLPNNE